ncbi:MAG: four helix bundle protein [Bacteroidales bacterium]
MGGFGFKELSVWQKSIELTDFVISVTEKLNSRHQHYRLKEQMEAAASSIACNIAEGKGRNSKKEFIHFLYVARGSLYETITLANIFHRRQWIQESDFHKIEELSFEIASMIKGLINSLMINNK